ncbi:MAG: hypothetical protein Q7T80_17305 [Methanoregula sp.]|nr:hypothetical protein [Methanoregula sp.]
MDTKLTGIINEGDTREIKEWIGKTVGSLTNGNTDMAEIKREISLLRLTVDQMNKKIDNIERILEKVSD